MVIQNNLNAINANNKLGVNVMGTKKSTEKLSSGFRINRAADDAAGLAISEKMRAQLRGLNQAIRNANDGISLIQTAEGALDETHAMLKRLKELAVQAGNETYSDEERTYMQDEINRIREEIDRIAEATDFNGIKLLNGNLAGMRAGSSDAGPLFATYLTANNAGTVGGELLNGDNATLEGSLLTSSLAGVTLQLRDSNVSEGGEGAVWSADGKTLTLNLISGRSYDQAQIDSMIARAVSSTGVDQENAPADVSLTLKNGMFVFTGDADFTVEVGTKASSAAAHNGVGQAGNLAQFLAGANNDWGTTDGASSSKFADTILFTSNNFGVDTRQIAILTDAAVGEESVTRVNANDELLGIQNGQFVLRLATNTEYTNEDIQRILAKAGLDYTVSLTSANQDPNNSVTFRASQMVTIDNLNEIFPDAAADAPDFTGATIAIAAGATAHTAAWTTVNSIVDDLMSRMTFVADDDDNVTVAQMQASFRESVVTAVKANLGISDDDTVAANDAVALLETAPFTAAERRVRADAMLNAALADAGIGLTAAATAVVADATAGEAFAEAVFNNLGDDAFLILNMGHGAGVGSNRELGKGNGITFQIGANNAAEQRVTLNVDDMSSSALGLANFSVRTVSDAQDAMDSVEAAIVKVSAQRAGLGAMQNRLEHTVNSLTVATENLTAAESQIRDTDMATEMVQYTKFNILQQAAQAMLAQANQAPQAILQLLR